MKRSIGAWIATSFLLLAACAGSPGGAGAGAAEFEVVLTPRASTGAIKSLGVQMKLAKPDLAAGQAMLRLPMIYASVVTARYEVKDISARDDAGPLTLVQTDEPADPANSIYFRRWAADRATVGDVTVAYEAPGSLFQTRTTPGPPFNLQPEEGGFAGAGVVFMIAPESDTQQNVRLSWNMNDAPKGWRGVWSLGEGDVRTKTSPSSVVNAYYMVGPVKAFPDDGRSDLVAYWMREPHFDMTALVAWVQKAHRALSIVFKHPNERYGVFFRVNPNSASGTGGAALVQSFMATYGEAQNVSVEGMRGLLAHEVTHSFTEGLDGPNGGVSWYGEGLAEYYSTQLSFRAGLLTADEMLQVINSRSEAYYGNAFVGIPNTEITNGFWRERQIQRLPYGRGWSYFVLTDHRIREKSAGRRSLVDLVLAMNARRDRDGNLEEADWLELIQAELGDDGVREFRDMESGKLVVPPDGALGPCFVRRDAKYNDQPGYRWERVSGVQDSQCNIWGPIAGL